MDPVNSRQNSGAVFPAHDWWRKRGGLHQGGPELAVAAAEQGEGAERGQAPG